MFETSRSGGLAKMLPGLTEDGDSPTVKKSADAKTMYRRFRHRLWQPPRRHGEIIEDRTVSFLELFYDLVFVVLIARAAHTLAHHVTWRGVFDFAVVFGLIWIAWLNGTLHHDLHGREDSRSRTFIFLQMLLLATLAVYTGDAAGDGGEGFALVYTALLLVLTWLWYAVRIHDTEEYMSVTGRYLIGMATSIVVMGVSVFVSDDARIGLWAVFVMAWLIGAVLQFRSTDEEVARGMAVTDSMVERFGLFTIIVLGEVVVGVVDGLSEAVRDTRTIATGLIGLSIGFGFWWTYFDSVGRRLPRRDRVGMAQWLFSHLPVSMAIAASGAAMVSLVEHAGDARAAAATTWLLAGAVALMLISLVLTMNSLADFERLERVYRPVTLAMVVGAAVALLMGWWRPAPWKLVLALAAIQSAVWFFAVDRFLRHGGTENPLQNS
jgi:low temperature requirement protein LtrA